MSARLLAASWREVRPILLWQAAGIVVTPVVFVITAGAQAGWSAFAGYGIGFLGTAYLMVALLKRSFRAGGGATIADVFASWLIKVALTLGLLLLALRSRALPPLPLIAGLSGSMVAYWLAMVVGREKYAGDVNGK